MCLVRFRVCGCCCFVVVVVVVAVAVVAVVAVVVVVVVAVAVAVAVAFGGVVVVVFVVVVVVVVVVVPARHATIDVTISMNIFTDLFGAVDRLFDLGVGVVVGVCGNLWFWLGWARFQIRSGRRCEIPMMKLVLTLLRCPTRR